MLAVVVVEVERSVVGWGGRGGGFDIENRLHLHRQHGYCICIIDASANVLSAGIFVISLR